jgi:hypothetical protein
VSALLIAGLSLGTRFPGSLFPTAEAPYTLLWRHVPGWSTDLAPGPLILFVTLPLALLAGGAASRMCGWRIGGGHGDRRPFRTAAVALMALLIVLEGWARIPLTPVPTTSATVLSVSASTPPAG